MSTVRTLVVILAALVSVRSCSKGADPDAQHAAEKWLGLVDGGQYAQSWTEAASYFKAHLDSPAREKSPVFQFDTSFAKKQGAVETVTPMKDTDGTWRVSGYYIK